MKLTQLSVLSALLCAGGMSGSSQCASAEVLSVSQSPESQIGDSGGGHGAPGVQTADGTPDNITVTGPILGSMDSAQLNHEFTCTSDGLTMKITITRSAEYNGAVLKNVPWRPVFHVIVVPHREKLNFEVIWRMRLTTGTAVHIARVPSFPDQMFPLRTQKLLQFSGR